MDGCLGRFQCPFQPKVRTDLDITREVEVLREKAFPGVQRTGSLPGSATSSCVVLDKCCHLSELLRTGSTLPAFSSFLLSV